MPRANRYILPGHIYHLTHRCHDRNFLLRFQVDRIEYCSRLRDAVNHHRISLFDYCITCNHIHLLCTCKRSKDLSCFMQQLQGEFAEYFNNRKHRSGAFWGDRFHSTMVDSGDYLWNCLRYIDLNMVRAGVVCHPRDWPWCGHMELTGKRQRYRLLDIDRLVQLLGLPNAQSLAEIHEHRIAQSIRDGCLARQPIWTESIAIGGRNFVEAIASKTQRRKKLRIATTEDGAWFVREDLLGYDQPESLDLKMSLQKQS
jgi:putative transposase